jgi:predicted transcriptional regulator
LQQTKQPTLNFSSIRSINRALSHPIPSRPR